MKKRLIVVIEVDTEEMGTGLIDEVSIMDGLEEDVILGLHAYDQSATSMYWEDKDGNHIKQVIG